MLLEKCRPLKEISLIGSPQTKDHNNLHQNATKPMTGVLISARALTPISRRAAALGIVLFFAWMGHGIGGFQGGFFFDQTGDYTWSFANAAIAGVLNLLVVGSLYFTINRRSTGHAYAA